MDFEQVTNFSSMLWFLILGVFSGISGSFFLKSIQKMETISAKINWPVWSKLGLAGLVVGLVALIFPGVWGNGYGITNEILQVNSDEKDFSVLLNGSILFGLNIWKISIILLLGLLIAKFITTVVAVGTGTVGGVFTPTLFLGAGLGAAFGQILNYFTLDNGVPIAAFALVGMGSVLAATTRSPLFAIILIFEISLKYELMPPLMIGCVVATLISRGLHKPSVYTAPLYRRGLEFDQEDRQMGSATDLCVGDLMKGPTSPIKETDHLPQISEIFLKSPRNYLPVLSKDKRLVGIISLQDVKAHLSGGDELRAIIALDLMRPVETVLTPNTHLMDALPTIMSSEIEMIPVVNTEREMRLVGSISRSQTLGSLSESIGEISQKNNI
jgi:CIC family chloride channel protein